MAGNGNSKSLKNLKPWQKGQSGNPAGAKPGKRWSTLIREIMEMPAVVRDLDRDREKLELFERKLGRELTNRDVVVISQLGLAKDKVAAAKLIMDREEGRPRMEQEEDRGEGTYLDFLDGIASEEGGADDAD